MENEKTNVKRSDSVSRHRRLFHRKKQQKKRETGIVNDPSAPGSASLPDEASGEDSKDKGMNPSGRTVLSKSLSHVLVNTASVLPR